MLPLTSFLIRVLSNDNNGIDLYKNRLFLRHFKYNDDNLIPVNFYKPDDYLNILSEKPASIRIHNTNTFRIYITKYSTKKLPLEFFTVEPNSSIYFGWFDKSTFIFIGKEKRSSPPPPLKKIYLSISIFEKNSVLFKNGNVYHKYKNELEYVEFEFTAVDYFYGSPNKRISIINPKYDPVAVRIFQEDGLWETTSAMSYLGGISVDPQKNYKIIFAAIPDYLEERY